ncbi:MAG: DinB family protein, partial [Tepidiformaceae bacterium]
MNSERIDRLSEAPKSVAYLIADASDERLDAQPAPGEWSARTIMAHLRDDEFLCMRICLERALAEDDPEVLLVDGVDWVANRNRGRERKELIVADFALQRQASAGILRSLRDEDWARPMHHAQYGKFTVS